MLHSPLGRGGIGLFPKVRNGATLVLSPAHFQSLASLCLLGETFWMTAYSTSRWQWTQDLLMTFGFGPGKCGFGSFLRFPIPLE